MDHNDRLKIIDYFKGISIIMIFVCHIVQVFDVYPLIGAISSFGRMGCQIFFVLSGYTTAMSYEKKHIKTFYTKRLLSLIPGYWLSILLTVIISFVTIIVSGTNQLGTSLKVGDIIINLLLLNGIVPTEANNMVFRGGWFIGTLFVLYSLFPLLHKGYKKYDSIFLYGCIIGSIIISALLFLYQGNVYSGCSGFLYFSFINQLPPFVLGILMYHNMMNKKKLALKSLLLFVISIVLFYFSVPFRAVFIPFIFSLSFIYFLRLLWLKKLLCCKFITKVGKLSYPMFLLHIFVIWDIPRLILSQFLSLNIFTCIVWGIISFFIVYYFSIAYNKLINLISKHLNSLFV